MTDFNDTDLRDFTPFLLNMAAETTSLDFQRNYKDTYGMLRTEWRVLFHIGQYGPQHAKDICARARIHKTKVSRAVAALEKKRFVRRATQEDDRRHALLTLTTQGKAAFVDLKGSAQAFDRKLTAQFTEAERDVLTRCLTKIARL